MDRDRSAVTTAQLPLRRTSGSDGAPPMPRSSNGSTTYQQPHSRQQQQQQQHWPSSASRDGSVPNGVLLGSLAEYLPRSAVAYANTAATATAASAAPGAPSASASPAVYGGSHHAHPSPPIPLEVQSLSVLLSSQLNSEHASPRVLPSGDRVSNGAPPLGPSPKLRQHQLGTSPQLSSQETALRRSGSNNNVVGSQDLRSSKHSITVLSVKRDGQAQEWPRPPSSASTAQAVGESTPASTARLAPAKPPRPASLHKADSASSTPRGSVTGRVQAETTAPIHEASLSTASTLHSATPLKQQQQPSSAPVPRPPRHSSGVSNGSAVYGQQAPLPQPQSRSSPSASTYPAQHPARVLTARPVPSPHPMPPAAQTSGSAPSNASSDTVHGSGTVVEAGALVPLSHMSPHKQQQQHGAVLHHRPAYNAAAATTAWHARDPLPTGPATLQISTTTLTTAVKKVRYLLPDAPFNPDAPDPSDMNGLTAAEEAALLDPVQYTRAAEDVASCYPMLLRRSSAQGGDLLPRRRSSSSVVTDPDASRPTFLLDDGNRWARETKRAAVATTRDPSGTAATHLPSPSILRKGSAGEAAQEAFPAYQRVSATGSSAAAADTNGFLLQRHVQQMATGKQLVQGTSFQPPPTGRRHLERRQRERAGARLDAQLAAATGAKRDSASAGLPLTAPQRRGTLDGLYDEIARRTQQNRRAALPATSQGAAAAAPPPALPPPPPPPPPPASGERRRVRQHPSSVDPAPPHRLAGRAGLADQIAQRHPLSGMPTSHQPDVAAAPQQQQQQQQQIRSSSQPCIPTAYHHHYHDETLSSSELGNWDGYRTPLMHTGAAAQAPPTHQQHQQQQQHAQQDRRVPSAVPHTYAAGPPLQRPYASPPQHQRQHDHAHEQMQQQHTPYYPDQRSLRAPTTASSTRPRQGQLSTGPTSQPQGSPPPRHQPESKQHPPPQPQQQQSLPHVSAHHSSATAGPGSSSNGSAQIPGYTSGRFSKYNGTLPAAVPVPTSEERFYASTTSDDRSNSAPSMDGHLAPAEPSWRAQQQQHQYQQQQQHQYQQQQSVAAQTGTPKPRPPQQRQPRPQPQAQHDPQPHPQQQQQQRQQHRQPPQQQYRQEEAPVYDYEPEDGDDHADWYAGEDETAERQHQRRPQHEDDYDDDDSPYAAEESFLDDPVTDVAGRRAPRPQQRPAAPVPEYSSLEASEASASGGSGGAVAEVRRPLPDQHHHATYAPPPLDGARLRAQPPQQQQQQQEQQRRAEGSPSTGLDRPHPAARAHHSHRTRAASSTMSSPSDPPPTAAAVSSVFSAHRSTASTRASHGPASGRGSAPPLRNMASANTNTPPSTAAFASSSDVSSCDTETQPITVSERGEDELAEAEEDELAKKGPPLLVLGDEVYAPEGYFASGEDGDEEGEEWYDEAAGAAIAGAVAPEAEEEEQEYWAGEQAAEADGRYQPLQHQQQGFYLDDLEDEELPAPGEAHREL